MNYEIGSSYFNAYIFNGTELPLQIDTKCECLINITGLDWISFNSKTVTLTVETSNSSYVGDHKILFV